MMDLLSILLTNSNLSYNDIMIMEYHLIRDLVKLVIKNRDNNKKFLADLLNVKLKSVN